MQSGAAAQDKQKLPEVLPRYPGAHLKTGFLKRVNAVSGRFFLKNQTAYLGNHRFAVHFSLYAKGERIESCFEIFQDENNIICSLKKMSVDNQYSEILAMGQVLVARRGGQLDINEEKEPHTFVKTKTINLPYFCESPHPSPYQLFPISAVELLFCSNPNRFMSVISKIDIKTGHVQTQKNIEEKQLARGNYSIHSVFPHWGIALGTEFTTYATTGAIIAIDLHTMRSRLIPSVNEINGGYSDYSYSLLKGVEPDGTLQFERVERQQVVSTVREPSLITDFNTKLTSLITTLRELGVVDDVIGLVTSYYEQTSSFLELCPKPKNPCLFDILKYLSLRKRESYDHTYIARLNDFVACLIARSNNQPLPVADFRSWASHFYLGTCRYQILRDKLDQVTPQEVNFFMSHVRQGNLVIEDEIARKYAEAPKAQPARRPSIK